MGFTVAKRVSFSAGHYLQGLPEGHPATRVHGHNYQAELILYGDGLDEAGMIIDAHDLDQVKQWIGQHLDHRLLNDVFARLPDIGSGRPHETNPTAERLAWLLYQVAGRIGAAAGWADRLVAVRVAATPGTWAEYRPSLAWPDPPVVASAGTHTNTD